VLDHIVSHQRPQLMQVVFVESIERTGRHFQRRWDRAGGTAHDRALLHSQHEPGIASPTTTRHTSPPVKPARFTPRTTTYAATNARPTPLATRSVSNVPAPKVSRPDSTIAGVDHRLKWAATVSWFGSRAEPWPWHRNGTGGQAAGEQHIWITAATPPPAMRTRGRSGGLIRCSHGARHDACHAAIGAREPFAAFQHDLQRAGPSRVGERVVGGHGVAEREAVRGAGLGQRRRPAPADLLATNRSETPRPRVNLNRVSGTRSTTGSR